MPTGSIRPYSLPALWSLYDPQPDEDASVRGGEVSGLRQCSTCGEMFGQHEPYCAALKDEQRQDAERRVERFWSLVCERAEREGCYNSIAGKRILDYGAAARAILAEMQRASGLDDSIPDPFDGDESRLWTCSDEACGEHPDIMDSRWRWTGSRWQHHHGYPIGHVDAVRRAAE